jgi:hypothetical protein
MRLIDYFDRGADLLPDRQSHRVANGLLAAGLTQRKI